MNIENMFNDMKYDCKCKICGKTFMVTKGWQKKKRVLCGSDECAKEDRRLAMERYRATEKGREATRLQNLRYKRPDIEKKCEVCGEKFITARKSQYICDKKECQSKGKYLRIKKYRNLNRDKSRARDIVSKRIRRGVSLKKEPCIICGCNQVEAHHHNYKRGTNGEPLDNITYLCKDHHWELHSWDSN